ncbi:hypothetical protein OG462_17025 [Streptomyces sp. NBC_01077]|uniref:hypothetical protein n=1 Tax=Streptomyces sp. NBC_01077 TaxID=2903746 RepID=UPI003864EF78|nr:hypothetical protein OG462_17025 [Streptomyces sp. NBC_01077]
MSFEEDWAAEKVAAADSTRMRLNQVAPSAGGSGGAGNADLSVSRDELGAIGGDAYVLRERLAKDGDHARPGTFDAAIALTNSDFASGSALLTVHDRWNTQLRTLLDACAHISNHLDYSAASHAREEQDIAASLSVATVSGHFS